MQKTNKERKMFDLANIELPSLDPFTGMASLPLVHLAQPSLTDAAISKLLILRQWAALSCQLDRLEFSLP